jgi:hypothetical protein
VAKGFQEFCLLFQQRSGHGITTINEYMLLISR